MLESLFHNQDTSSQIEIGSVGWEDEDEYAFIGSGDDDGHTLIRVQLFRGRDVTKPINPTRAQGIQIVCHLSGGLFRIPKKDTRVYVAIPKGMEHMIGAGVIFATVEKNGDQLQKDRAVIDYGDDVHVIIRGKSVSLQDPDNRFLTVGSPRAGGAAGLTFQAKDGSGGVIQEGVVSWFVASGGSTSAFIQMTPSKIECHQTSGGYWSLDQNFYVLGQSCTVQGGHVYLGLAPTPANGALWGITGVAGVMSTSVFVSV